MMSGWIKNADDCLKPGHGELVAATILNEQGKMHIRLVAYNVHDKRWRMVNQGPDGTPEIALPYPPNSPLQLLAWCALPRHYNPQTDGYETQLQADGEACNMQGEADVQVVPIASKGRRKKKKWGRARTPTTPDDVA